MADPTLPLFRLPEPKLRHLFIEKKPQRLDYRGRGRGKLALREVERSKHGKLLKRQLGRVEEEFKTVQKSIADHELPEIEGLILQIVTEPGYPIGPKEIHSLTSRTGSRSGPLITLLNAIQITDSSGLTFTRIALHVPFGGLSYLENKVREFSEKSGKKGHAYLSNIRAISRAALDALWTDLDPLPKDADPRWWELWVRRYPEDTLTRFGAAVEQLHIETRGDPLLLPDHRIVVARATYATLSGSIPLLDTLAEVRAARPCAVELTDLDAYEQREWIDEALRRIRWPPSGAPAVCVLDTGVNRGHPLISPILDASDNQSVFAGLDGSDGHGGHGHGTPMAGLAAYGDLRGLLLSTDPWDQKHCLESVRLLDPRRPHDPQNYGSVTQQAISLPEIKAPQRKRVFSLAVTAPGPDDGRPTAWSAAVDAAAYGDSDSGKRLILVSAGNLAPHEIGSSYAYPDDNHNTPIENPAQAWNALTVGALTHLARVTEPDDESRRMVAIARGGALSPFTRTSCEWDEHWPLKPEITMEGGNVARHAEHGPDCRESLELVSTSARAMLGRSLCAFGATSAATAQASRLAAQIIADYPALWPESVRGLMVHSARWTEVMLGGINPHRAFRAPDRQRFIQMLRCFGYGEPEVVRARFSATHAATLIREDQLRPYSGKPGDAALEDCHIHHLPWPKELLARHFDVTCTLRVTLSYFTAPNPSANNALGGSRYRYGGCLLRFLARHKEESSSRFQRRLEKTADEENDENGEPEVENVKSDAGWALGTRLRGKGGSLIQDIWRGSAADLAQMDRIAVFPVKGWWASRKFPDGSDWADCHDLPIRYSLIVSVEAEQDIPLYNEIQNQISISLGSS